LLALQAQQRPVFLEIDGWIDITHLLLEVA
jgi:hypothetical protein